MFFFVVMGLDNNDVFSGVEEKGPKDISTKLHNLEGGVEQWGAIDQEIHDVANLVLTSNKGTSPNQEGMIKPNDRLKSYYIQGNTYVVYTNDHLQEGDTYHHPLTFWKLKGRQDLSRRKRTVTGVEEIGNGVQKYSTDTHEAEKDVVFFMTAKYNETKEEYEGPTKTKAGDSQFFTQAGGSDVLAELKLIHNYLKN